MDKSIGNIKAVLCFYLFFCVIFIPFPFHIFSFQKDISQYLFGDFLSKIVSGFLNIELVTSEITSDSILMYALITFLFLLSIVFSVVFSIVDSWKSYRKKVLDFICIFLTYYLALQLLKYGFHKLFKGQFYLPEPNILYTPLGQLDKDILFWSTMGISYSYNIFMGMLEIIPAVLLLFRKTRVLGLLVAVPVLVNIVAINFSFDISVKVYSCLLLGLSLFLLFPYIKAIVSFFTFQEKISLPQIKPSLSFQPLTKKILKVIILVLILIEALFPYLTSGYFNDDVVERPYLHGAYEVMQVMHGDEVFPMDSLGVKRVFIHRRGYIIFQDKNDAMQDFKLEIDKNKNLFTLTDYDLNQRSIEFEYEEKDSLLYLQFFQKGNEYLLWCEPLDWKSLPALQNQFHWTIEGVE